VGYQHEPALWKKLFGQPYKKNLSQI
jgi:hypothetical protein